MSDSASVQVNITESGPVTRVIEVEVAVDRVREARGAALSQLRQRARIPGFRPGKAPPQVVAKAYRGDLEEALLRTLVEGTIAEAIDRVEARVLNVRDVRPEPVAEDGPFRYVATLEVPPELEVDGYRKLKLQRPLRPVADEDVERVLEDLRSRNATWRPAREGETADAHDQVVLSYVATRDGEPVPDGQAENHRAEIGSGALNPRFEAGILGAAAGEKRAFDVDFGEDDAPNPEMAGQALHFEVEIHALEKRELPELDDAFAGQMLEGVDLAGLRQRIRDDLAAAAAAEGDRAVEQQLLEELLARHSFEVPEGLVARRREQLAEQTAQRLVQQGYPMDSVRQLAPMLMSDAAGRAEQDVRIGFILERIADKESLEVSDDEVEQDIRRAAEQVGQSPEAYLDRVRQEGMFETIRGELRNRKALDRVRESATIKDVSPEAYAKAREKAAGKDDKESAQS